MHKLGQEINPENVIGMGGRMLHAIKYLTLKNSKSAYKIRNYHNHLFSPGKGKILEYGNKVENMITDGISYVLQDNVRGTNFPLWYEDNAYFKFEITKA